MISPLSRGFCPYRGLAHYDEDYAQFFVGRESDIEVVLANLYAAPLTVLYGQSGVGKTSLLAAGVVPRVKATGRAALAVFREWQRPDFAAALDAEIRRAVAEVAPGAALPNADLALDELLSAGARLLDGPVFLVFDQFEEYFLYHSDSDLSTAFEAALARAVNRRAVNANFLLCLREEGLSKLDRFQGRIPHLMSNTIRLERLDRTTARRAIVEPLERYTKLREGARLRGVTIEPELVEALLSEEVRFDQGGRGTTAASPGGTAAGAEAPAIELPFLQLVLTRLWSAENAPEAPVLRRETLQRLGGANGVVRAHLDAGMRRFTPAQRHVAAELFHHLVTPSGSKIAHTRGDLAGLLEASPRQAQAISVVVDALSAPGTRILKRIEPLAAKGEDRYEIFHDALAPGVLDWRARFLAGRKLRRRLLQVAGAGLVVAVAVAAAWAYAGAMGRKGVSEQLASAAITQLRASPEQAKTLAAEAFRTAPTQASSDAWYRAWVEHRLLRATTVHRNPVRSVAFSRRGDRLLTSSQDDSRSAKIWNADGTGTRFALAGHRKWTRRAAWGPGDTLVVTAGFDSTARIWNLRTRSVLHTLRSRSVVADAAFTADGRFVVTVAEDSTRYIWNTATGELVDSVHPQSGIYTSVDVAPTGYAAAGTDDGGVELFRADSGRRVGWITRSGMTVRKVRFDTTGTRLAVVGDERAEVYRLEREYPDSLKPPPVRELRLVGHQRIIFDVAWSPDGRYIATASRDRSVRVWSATTGESLVVLPGHDDWVYGVSFSPDGKHLATASGDGTVRIWALTNLPVRIVSPAARPRADGERRPRPLAVERGAVALRDPRGGQALRLRMAEDSVVAADFTPDGEWIVAAGARGFALWSADGKQVRQTPYMRPDRGAGLFTSPGSRWLIAAREDGGVSVYDLSSAPRPPR